MEKLNDDKNQPTNKQEPENKNDKAEEDLKIKEQLAELMEATNISSYNSKNKNKGIKDSYKFWDTQPVPGFKDNKYEDKIGPIDENTDVSKVKAEPYKLPSNCEWVDIDITNKKDLRNVSYIN